MRIKREIRIAVAVIAFSIMITSTFSLELEVFNKEKNAVEDIDLFKYIKDGKMKMLENSRNCSIAKGYHGPRPLGHRQDYTNQLPERRASGRYAKRLWVSSDS